MHCAQDVLDHLHMRQRHQQHHEKQQRAAQLFLQNASRRQQQAQPQQQQQHQEQPPSQQLGEATTADGHQEDTTSLQAQWSAEFEQEAVRLVREGVLKVSQYPAIAYFVSAPDTQMVAKQTLHNTAKCLCSTSNPVSQTYCGPVVRVGSHL
jgi:hypothetical protein